MAPHPISVAGHLKFIGFGRISQQKVGFRIQRQYLNDHKFYHHDKHTVGKVVGFLCLTFRLAASSETWETSFPQVSDEAARRNYRPKNLLHWRKTQLIIGTLERSFHCASNREKYNVKPSQTRKLYCPEWRKSRVLNKEKADRSWPVEQLRSSFFRESTTSLSSFAVYILRRFELPKQCSNSERSARGPRACRSLDLENRPKSNSWVTSNGCSDNISCRFSKQRCLCLDPDDTFPTTYIMCENQLRNSKHSQSESGCLNCINRRRSISDWSVKG